MEWRSFGEKNRIEIRNRAWPVFFLPAHFWRFWCFAMSVKLIAVDMDGTVLDSSSGLPEVNRRALEIAYQSAKN